MDKSLYDMIFKRKSFHLFRNTGDVNITEAELNEINNIISSLTPLVSDIKTKIIISKDGASCHRGQEYMILFYSEKKENYLQNIGYLGEQLDLKLVSMNIGTLWFGIGKPKEKELDGLDYVIMIAIKKVDSADKFRQDMFRSKRKALEEVASFDNPLYKDIIDVTRFAPSACNTQPWLVDIKNNLITVNRYSPMGKRGIMPKAKVSFYNQMDIGIFLCFMELCLDHHNMKYEKNLFIESDHDNELNKTAIYKIIK